MTDRTDRELLEAAAKAAGIAIVPCTCSDKRWPFKHDEAQSGKRGHWNPLVDDGDALRLAVKLDIEIYRGDADGEAMFAGYWGKHPKRNDTTRLFFFEYVTADPYAATRRAIVRAAAAMAPD